MPRIDKTRTGRLCPMPPDANVSCGGVDNRIVGR